MPGSIYFGLTCPLFFSSTEAGCAKAEPVRPFRDQALMLRGGLLEGRLLLGRGLFLVLLAPFVVGHAVDDLAAFVLAHGDALFVGGVLHPVRQAVAAEAGE